MLNRLRLALRSVFQRGRLEREMQEEMQAHLSQSVARLQARGMSERDARHAARREFGNVDSLQEQARDARGLRWIESTIGDLRFGCRHFARTPLSSATMLLLLGLGIGVNAALFTVLHSITTLPPRGIPRDPTLVRIRGLDVVTEARRIRGRDISYPELSVYAAQRSVFADVAAFDGADVLLDFGNAQVTSTGTADFVTDNFFRTLGIRPVLGAGLPAAALTGPPLMIAVISHVIWDQEYGRSADVLGKTIKVNNQTVTIVGVGPPDFRGPHPWGSARRLWLPLNARAPIKSGSASAFASYDSLTLNSVARLQPGVRAEQASKIVAGLATRAEREKALRSSGVRSADVVPILADNHQPQVDSENYMIAAMFGAVGLLILLITCTNVSTLLVGLAVARRREIAVRLSLGAPRVRIIRQLITESVLLSLGGAAFALGVIATLLRAFGARVPDVQIALQWQAIGFTFGFAILTGLVFGVSPALHATRLAVSDVLKNAAAAVAAGRSWLHSGLVVAQIAFTQPLLVGLGALLLVILAQTETKSKALSQHILSVRLNAYAGNFSIQNIEERRDQLRGLRDRLAAVPGVVGVVAQGSGHSIFDAAVHPSDRVPGIDYKETFQVRTDEAPRGYFAMMDVKFLRGRDFLPAEVEPDNSIIIDREVANALWPGADPIGKRLLHGKGKDSTGLVVVGVVDVANETYSNPGHGDVLVYVPKTRWGDLLLIRTSVPASAMIPTIRAVVNSELPHMPVTSARTLADQEAEQQRFGLQVSSAAAAGGLFALFLSAIGLYAVVSFAVAQRTREIGVRTALGAEPGQIIGVFFRRGLRLTGFGLILGLPLSVTALQLFSSWQSIPTTNTPALAALIAGLVIVVAGLATWIPARRAAGVDPLNALRAQ